MDFIESERYSINGEICDTLQKVLESEHVLSMKKDTQHGSTSTYEHCMNVAAMSLLLARTLHILVDEKQLLTGAMLHDFFLYDWHDGRKKSPGLFGFHCFTHPAKALENAKEEFPLTWKEENIIRSHMFPTTLLHPPRCKEAWIVCMADKICAVMETFGFHQCKMEEIL